MPIRQENKDRYPPDWSEISWRIRARAGNRCEKCGVDNHALGGRLDNGEFWPATPLGDNGIHLQWPRPGEWSVCIKGDRREFLRIIRIVLTVAHLDHTPENCADENLKALCQRCHNRLDAKMRRAGIRDRHRSSSAISDFFLSSDRDLGV